MAYFHVKYQEVSPLTTQPQRFLYGKRLVATNTYIYICVCYINTYIYYIYIDATKLQGRCHLNTSELKSIQIQLAPQRVKLLQLLQAISPIESIQNTETQYTTLDRKNKDATCSFRLLKYNLTVYRERCPKDKQKQKCYVAMCRGRRRRWRRLCYVSNAMHATKRTRAQYVVK